MQTLLVGWLAGISMPATGWADPGEDVGAVAVLVHRRRCTPDLGPAQSIEQLVLGGRGATGLLCDIRAGRESDIVVLDEGYPQGYK